MGSPRALVLLLTLGVHAASVSALLSPPDVSLAPLAVPVKTLMGPGPTSVHPRVLAAAALPMLGHMHGEVSAIMADIQALLRYAWQTNNSYIMAISASGHGGMEASITNLVEPGDVVLVGVNGIWGERAADMARRAGGDVRELKLPAGSVYSLDDLRAGFDAHPRAKLLFLTHGESSTGTLQPLDGVGALCKEKKALFILDTVCTLAGVPLHLGAAGVDVAYSGSQKALGAPPGLSPFTLSPSARAKLAKRPSPVPSYYFDHALMGDAWGVDRPSGRWYHSTPAVSSLYGLREALAMLASEGLEATWQRHADAAAQLHGGLRALGLKLFVDAPEHRLATVTTIVVPEGIAWADVTAFMMAKYKIEISGGLGPSAGKVWRVGLMGNNARPGNVALLLVALKEALQHAGWPRKGAADAAEL